MTIALVILPFPFCSLPTWLLFEPRRCVIKTELLFVELAPAFMHAPYFFAFDFPRALWVAFTNWHVVLLVPPLLLRLTQVFLRVHDRSVGCLRVVLDVVHATVDDREGGRVLDRLFLDFEIGFFTINRLFV